MTNSAGFTQQYTDNDTLCISTGRMFDNDNAHDLISIIKDADAGGTKFIIIDMILLQFLSSAGVGAILGNIELFRERNGDIVLCNVSPTIQRILKVLDVGEYLTVKDTPESARDYCMTKSQIG